MTAPAGTTIDLRDLPPTDRLAAHRRAAEFLGQGKIVAAVGDTGPMVLMDGSSSLATTIAAQAAEDVGAMAWLAPQAARVESVLGSNRVLARLLKGLTPGPAIFRVGLDEQGFMAARTSLGVGPGVVDDAREGLWTLRICSESPAATIAHTYSGSLLAYEPLADRAETVQALGDRLSALGAGVDMTLIGGSDSGAMRRGPSVIRVDRAGSVRVEREGAYEARYILKHMAMTILFVCTGNTCRSPMAEAIATGVLQKIGAKNVRVQSAGTGATRGAPPATEGVRAVRMLGYAPTGGGSQPLTRQLVADADIIFTMTRSHLQNVLALDRDAAGKARVLDPDGEDVPDPIGMGQDAYDSTARRLETLIQQRLKEFGP